MSLASDRPLRAVRINTARSAGRAQSVADRQNPATLACLPPIARADARVLILGSMPGAASLRAQQYYAHPRNTFWPILTTLFEFAPELDYASRVRALHERRIAVWDVLASCQRSSSLDADIDPESVRVNDFVAFFARHPDIDRVGCNGATAATIFKRRVASRLPSDRALDCVRLPSTSPAHASLDLAAKTEAWRTFLLR